MKPIVEHQGVALPLERDDVDTDQIIPKQFLKRIERSGYEDFLFFDWRRDPEFVLKRPRYAGASILVAGRNFGCGSSREHAAWALLDYGFQVVIASSFADIFYSNALKNGIVAIVLSGDEVATLTAIVKRLGSPSVSVSLRKKQVWVENEFQASFEIDDFRRHCLMEGLDEIALTLKHERDIAAYEERGFGEAENQ